MKNEFNMLNDIKNEVDNIEEVLLTEDEKKKMTSRVIKKLNKPRKKANRKAVIAASLAVALTGVFALTNEDVIAQINSVGRRIESFFEKEDDSFEKYKKDIIQVVEDKGIKFMLHEAMVDDEELYISASVDYNDVDKSQLKTKYKGPLEIIPSKGEPKIQIYLNG